MKTFDYALLELAAKAAGIDLYQKNVHTGRKSANDWNPLTDDGDAFRLMTTLDLDISRTAEGWVTVFHYATGLSSGSVSIGVDTAAATRRAIVCAAAEIGKQMGEENG